MKTCSIIGCEKEHMARTYCNNHYAQWARGTLGLTFHKKICKICGGKHKAHGYCGRHYQSMITTKKFKKKNPLYNTWMNMKRRCHNPDYPEYKNYGARGITVCDRWLNSYKKFEKDMGNKPSPRHSIDRIDNDKGYSPDNCRWATAFEQSLNQRVNKRNTSGNRGVLLYRGKWRAQIWVHKTSIHLGSFTNIEDAIKARKDAEIKYWAN